MIWPPKLREWYLNALLWLYIGLSDEEKEMFILVNKPERLEEAVNLFKLAKYFGKE